MKREFFYIRINSKDQNLDRQLITAQQMGIEEGCIFTDIGSGKDFMRPDYQLLKRCIREGDVIYIKSLDRLGRNKQMILDEWHDIVKVKKVDIVVLDIPLLDTTKFKDMGSLDTLISDIVLQILSYLAEEERVKMKINQAEGIKLARERGVKFGRQKIEAPDNFIDVYNQWTNNEMTAVKAMNTLGLKPNTFYRRVAEYEDKNGIKRESKPVTCND
ncbi:MAG: DNA recombinase [Epulopiscium sp. Nele67-Bin004]|nr:MAG: DNA recombinase [Epulopiscium sp. Nele67-Bin004]